MAPWHSPQELNAIPNLIKSTFHVEAVHAILHKNHLHLATTTPFSFHCLRFSLQVNPLTCLVCLNLFVFSTGFLLSNLPHTTHGSDTPLSSMPLTHYTGSIFLPSKL